MEGVLVWVCIELSRDLGVVRSVVVLLVVVVRLLGVSIQCRIDGGEPGVGEPAGRGLRVVRGGHALHERVSVGIGVGVGVGAAQRWWVGVGVHTVELGGEGERLGSFGCGGISHVCGGGGARAGGW